MLSQSRYGICQLNLFHMDHVTRNTKHTHLKGACPECRLNYAMSCMLHFAILIV